VEIESAGKFFFIGNDPILDLLNTVPVLGGRPVDLLGSFADVTRWLEESGLMTAEEARELRRLKYSAAEGAAALNKVKSLREALRALVLGLEERGTISKAVLATVNEILRSTPISCEIAWHAQKRRFDARWRSHKDDISSMAMAPLARGVVQLLSERDSSLLKKCENPVCVLHFYDTSKNHSRRWCSMDVCGNRIKAAKHYRRHRDETESNPKG
jgi:predicted RNA-binding Zn ribbon-like protein